MRRRTFLHNLGLAGAGSLFLPSLLPRSRGVAAAPLASTPRIVLAIGIHGTHFPGWEMLRGQDTNSAWNYSLANVAEGEFSPVLRPLWRHRAKTTVIDGLRFGTIDNFGDDHGKGYVNGLTGAPRLGGGLEGPPQAPSFDAALSAAMNMKMYSVGAGDNGYVNFTRPIRPDLGKEPILFSPRDMFDSLFPNGGGGSNPVLTPVQRSQADMLAAVAPMYDSVYGRLSTEDRRRMEQHRDMVRAAEQRFRNASAISCEAPDVPDTFYGGDSTLTAATSQFWDLTALAFSCQLAQIVHIGWSEMGATLPTAGMGVHEHAHAHNSDAASGQVMNNLQTEYVKMVADLADRLDQIPDENGTLLDNTIIIQLSDIASCNHEQGRWPVTMVGGGNFINAGKYYNFPDDPHNKFWTTIGNAMGWAINQFGLASFGGNDLRGQLAGVVR